jgi:hypothetical protein
MELFTIHATYMELRAPEAFVPAFVEEPALRPYAVANYRARGFVPYRATTHQEPSYPTGAVPPLPPELWRPPRVTLDGAAPLFGAVP